MLWSFEPRFHWRRLSAWENTPKQPTDEPRSVRACADIACSRWAAQLGYGAANSDSDDPARSSMTCCGRQRIFLNVAIGPCTCHLSPRSAWTPPCSFRNRSQSQHGQVNPARLLRASFPRCEAHAMRRYFAQRKLICHPSRVSRTRLHA